MKVQAKPETLSPRPDAWHHLAERLLAEGCVRELDYGTVYFDERKVLA